MKSVWFAVAAIAATTSAYAQPTIYKHVDESGRVTYSNKPMKGATVMELEPLTTIPGTPAGVLVAQPAAALQKAAVVVDKPADAKAEARPAVAVVTPIARQTLASIEPALQRSRDTERRKILEQELAREEETLATVRASLLQERQNPTLIAAVRLAQQVTEPTPSQAAEIRSNIDKASGRIRGLQATVAEHEKNIEALKKELGALKP